MKWKQHKIPMMVMVFAVLSLVGLSTALAQSPPVVTNVQAVQRTGSFVVDITYDLFDADGDFMYVSVYYTHDDWATLPIYCSAVTGDVGVGVASGSGLHIEWDAREDIVGALEDLSNVRVVANDEYPFPRLLSVWRRDYDGSNETPISEADTVAFGQSFSLRWEGTAPAVAGMPPATLAARDTVFPHDDGLVGYQYRLTNEPCDPQVEDCWHPRRFNEATGDSFAYYDENSILSFRNDGSGLDPFGALLPSGELEIQVRTRDVVGLETPEHLPSIQAIRMVVNHDPETILLDGETDWAHPEDPEVYPYYILLNDPLQIHHPFQSGDRIPDRSYVVFKALGRDDPRDALMDADYGVALSGFVQGYRDNYMGGVYAFSTSSSPLNENPAWEANPDGWAADTLGFLTGPRTEFHVSMRSTDEHGRRDGTPPSISFDVGFPPCVQCVELLPNSSTPSSYPPDLECVTDQEAHPCFQTIPEFRVAQSGFGDEYLEFIQPVFMLVDKNSGYVQVVEDDSGQEDQNYIFQANLYRMTVLLHGQDDPREAWPMPLNRIMAWRYQVDYDCDPYNLIKDGGGHDDLIDPTWGEIPGRTGLEIDPYSGLWKLQIDVAVPTQFMVLGPDNFRQFMPLIFGVPEEDADMVFEALTRQFGDGQVQAIALDQTSCGVSPPRPAKYHYFREVRPSVISPPTGLSWRDCYLSAQVPGIQGSLGLESSAMHSRDGVPVVKSFRIVVQTSAGDYTCAPPD